DKAMAKKNMSKDMNIVGHLSELRKRLMVTGLFFIIFFILGFIIVKEIYRFFENDIDFKLTVTSLVDIIWIYLIMASLIAIIFTLTMLSFQISLFIKQVLTRHKCRSSLGYIPAIFLLFVIGLVFGYLVFIKLILPFLLSLNDGMFNELFTVERYFRFLIRLTLPFALLFEIPVIMMFLTSLG